MEINMNTKTYYRSLRAAYRSASRNLMRDPNAIAICSQLISRTRSLANNWETGFGSPEPIRCGLYRNMSSQWSRPSNASRPRLFVSLSLTQFLSR